MNRQYVVEHNLVDRYLRNELNEQEAADFEVFYMDDPETLDELEAAEILFSQKKMPEAMRESAPVADDLSVGGGVRTRAGWNPWQWVSGALAMALVGAIVFPVGDRQEGFGNVQDVRLESVRSSESGFVISLSENSRAVLIRIPVAAANGAYHLSLEADGASFMQDHLLRDGYGEISVVVPRELLQRSDEWQIDVRGGDQVLMSAAIRVEQFDSAD